MREGKDSQFGRQLILSIHSLQQKRYTALQHAASTSDSSDNKTITVRLVDE